MRNVTGDAAVASFEVSVQGVGGVVAAGFEEESARVENSLRKYIGKALQCESQNVTRTLASPTYPHRSRTARRSCSSPSRTARG